MGLDKCIVMCMHQYGIILMSLFGALLIFCALPVHPSPLPTPSNQRSFYSSHSFAFPRMSYSWNDIACSCDVVVYNKKYIFGLPLVSSTELRTPWNT